MSNASNQFLEKHYLSGPVDNNDQVSAFTVRGVGSAGLDLVCQTVAAVGPAEALSGVIESHALRRAPEVVCWVVTSLRRARGGG